MTSREGPAQPSEGASVGHARALSDDLTRFAAALRRESHHLLKRPELLWQQLHNRLQWAGGETAQILHRAFAARTGEGARPWLRTRTRFVESEPLTRTISLPSPSNTFAVSPDGSFAVVAAGNDLVILDIETGDARSRLTGHADTITAFDLSPMGDRIVSGSKDGELKLWIAESGKEPARLRRHPSTVRCCAFSPDGSFVVSAGGSLKDWDEFHDFAMRASSTGLSQDRRRWLETRRDALEQDALLATAAMIWNAETGDPIATLTGSRKPVFACSISPDGLALVTASGNTATIWNLSDMSPRVTLSGHEGEVTDCAISADGKRIVTASVDNTLKVWDAPSGCELFTLKGHTGFVYTCAISPDDALIVSGAIDETLKIWDALTGRESRTLRGHGGWVTDCSISPDGSSLYSVSGQDQTLKIWDLEKVRLVPGERIEPTGAKACAISPDARIVVGACEEQGVQILRPDTGEQERLSARSRAAPTACSFSPNGRFFVAHGSVFDAATGKKRVDLSDYSGHALAVSPDGSYAVSASHGKKLRLKMWNTETGAMLRELEGHTGGAGSTLALSPDGAFIVASDHKALWIWRSRTGKVQYVRDAHSSGVTTCAVSPDTAFLVTTARDIKVWDARSLRERLCLAEDKHGIFACAINPASNLIAAGGPGGAVQFWDPSTGEQKGACRGHEASVAACVFTPDGQFLVSVGGDGWMRVWQVEDGLEVASLPVPARFSGVEGAAMPSSKLAISLRKPRIACVDGSYNLHVVDLEGLFYGPRIVTAFRQAGKLKIRCPACGCEQSICKADFGTLLCCSQRDCGLPLKLNPFTIRHPALWSRRSWPWS
ncbi:MAG TPA: WD40 repeat domain-containing protein [Blastocatellia bacterium]|nr:WD40 repeat domain-containing protein [Blastocatellia bacterium]